MPDQRQSQLNHHFLLLSGQKRCIIPVIGFYEWQHVGNEKIPWYIYHSENEILSIAGIYNDWIEDNTGEVLSTFSIVTTEANDMMHIFITQASVCLLFSVNLLKPDG